MARSKRRRGLSRRQRNAAIAIVVALLVGAGVWLWLRSGDGGEASPRAGDVGDAAAAPAGPADSALDLPELDASDAFVRDVVAGLSSRPQLAEWLATDRLVRRFVGSVVQVAAGLSPRDELEFMEPEGSFAVREPGEPSAAAVVDPASYRRYDPVAATFVSLDTEGTAELYRRLRPLFREAYRDLGFSEGSFDGVMARAFETLLAVPVPEGPIRVVPSGADAYEFRDPALEDLAPAQKHLLRMGPENVRRVQAKLRELAGALDLPMVATRDNRS